MNKIKLNLLCDNANAHKTAIATAVEIKNVPHINETIFAKYVAILVKH